jgi:hypothetical protein
MLLILERLEGKELCLLGSTCKRLNALVNDDRVWLSLYNYYVNQEIKNNQIAGSSSPPGSLPQGFNSWKEYLKSMCEDYLVRLPQDMLFPESEIPIRVVVLGSGGVGKVFCVALIY